MIFQEAPSPTLLGKTVQRILELLNYNFVDQPQFKVSVLSLILLVLVLLVATLISRIIRRVLRNRVLTRFHLGIGLEYTLLRLVHYVIVALGLLYAIKVGFSVDLTSVTVILGFLSVGIGFGLRNIAADLASGFILLFERPIRVSDRVKLDDGSIEGRIDRISLRSTIIVTNENMTVIVPNSRLVQSKIVNFSRGGNVRLNIPVGVAYGSDLDKLSEALLEAAKSVDEVLESPAPRVHFAGFGEAALNFEIRVWITQPHKHPQIRSKINFAIDRELRERNIEVGFTSAISLSNALKVTRVGSEDSDSEVLT
jgi:small-conductance mechanosensitive channel